MAPVALIVVKEELSSKLWHFYNVIFKEEMKRILVSKLVKSCQTYYLMNDKTWVKLDSSPESNNIE